jgi:uncharacterized coiled-coil protein SlyX
MIFAGILLNRSEVREVGKQLDAKIDRLDAKLEAKIDRLRDDIRQFDRTIGQHDARMDTLASRLANVEPNSI